MTSQLTTKVNTAMLLKQDMGKQKYKKRQYFTQFFNNNNLIVLCIVLGN